MTSQPADLQGARENRLRHTAVTLLRVVTGFLFFQHGAPKLFGSLPGSGEAEPAVELLTPSASPEFWR